MKKVLGWSICRPSKIAHFDNPVRDHDIFRFNISMDNALVMHIFERCNNLFPIIGCFFFCQAHLISEVPEKTLRTVFKNKLNVFGVMEKSINL